MSTKRILKWGVLLFLLAALPVMTVALAQEQGPAGKQLPVVTEPGESAAPATANRFESEANNTRQTADQIFVNDVVGGTIGAAGDVDFFKFEMPNLNHGFVLIDIDAASIGSSLDPVVCLQGSGGEDLGCSDDTDTLDSMLFNTLWGSGYPYSGAGPYYIRVTNYSGSGGVNNFHYELILSTPLLISAPAANLGTKYIAGIPFQSQDILAWSDLNTGGEKWVMFFDGSDLGILKDVTNVAAGPFEGESILISFGAQTSLPGVGIVKPQDVIEFHANQFGPSTSGTFSMYIRGSTWGLTTTAEKIDALGMTVYGPLGEPTCCGFPFSTTGLASVVRNGVTLNFADEDVFRMEEFWGLKGWGSFFDGSLTTGLAVEDVIATTYVDHSDEMLMTIQGSGVIAGHKVTQKDIFAVKYFGNNWSRYVWRGPQHGWIFNIDAFEYKGGY